MNSFTFSLELNTRILVLLWFVPCPSSCRLESNIKDLILEDSICWSWYLVKSSVNFHERETTLLEFCRILVCYAFSFVQRCAFNCSTEIKKSL
jgi:hypothetical protein